MRIQSKNDWVMLLVWIWHFFQLQNHFYLEAVLGARQVVDVLNILEKGLAAITALLCLIVIIMRPLVWRTVGFKILHINSQEKKADKFFRFQKDLLLIKIKLKSCYHDIS